MGKLDKNKRLKIDSLLNTSFELFIAKGINKTSISDIVEKAGVAKGTFYLYFKDKYDIKDRLIVHKTSQLFAHAYDCLKTSELTDVSDKIIYIVDHILDELENNKPLLSFIYKDLSWGVFKKTLAFSSATEDIDFRAIYRDILNESDQEYDNPEVMLFLIIELAGSAGYSSILYHDPISLEDLKPHLYQSIRGIIRDHTISPI